jgi:hypothetical protein
MSKSTRYLNAASDIRTRLNSKLKEADKATVTSESFKAIYKSRKKIP